MTNFQGRVNKCADAQCSVDGVIVCFTRHHGVCSKQTLPHASRVTWFEHSKNLQGHFIHTYKLKQKEGRHQSIDLRTQTQTTLSSHLSSLSWEDSLRYNDTMWGDVSVSVCVCVCLSPSDAVDGWMSWQTTLRWLLSVRKRTPSSSTPTLRPLYLRWRCSPVERRPSASTR